MTSHQGWLSVNVEFLSAFALIVGAVGPSAACAEVCLGELGPAFAALHVQVADDSAPPSVSAPQSMDGERPGAPPSQQPNTSAMRYALLAGARAGASNLISPQLVLAVTYGLGALELGATLGIEPLYIDVPDRILESQQGGAVPLSVQAGGRFVEGVFDLFAGGRTGLAHVFTLKERDVTVCNGVGDCGEYFDDKRIFEWRLGGYAGFAVPHDAAIRFRSEIGFDVALPSADERPLTPLWGLNALIGIELAP
jgi:hypothetical protein